MAASDVEGTNLETASLALSESSDDEACSLLDMDQVTLSGVEQHKPEGPSKTTAQAMKALEAAEEGNISRSSSPGIVSRPSSPRSLTGANSESTPLLDAGPAPPDYSQATAYRTFAPSNPYRRRDYGDTAQQPDEDYSDDSGSFFRPGSRKKKKKFRKYVRQNWRQICLLNLAIYSLLVTVILILRQLANWGNFPPTNRYYAEHPNSDDAIVYPKRQARFHKNNRKCSFDSYFLRGFSYNARMPTKFSFIEAMEPRGNSEFSDFHVSGTIEIRPAPYAQTAPADLWMSIATTRPWKVVEPASESNEDGWVLRFPQLEKSADYDDRFRTQSMKKPCLSFWIGIYVKHRYDIWDIRAALANIDIRYPESFGTSDNWWFQVSNSTQIYTTQGNISASFLDSENVDLRTTSGSIFGNFTLGESISLTTTSGDIDVLVDQSVTWDKKTTELRSSTVEGDTHISLYHEEYPAEWIPRSEQYNLKSHHRSQSGRISLDYNGWEGTLTGTTTKGSINISDVSGADFEYCSDVLNAVSDVEHACVIKGNLSSTSVVESFGGDIEVIFQEKSIHWPAVPV